MNMRVLLVLPLLIVLSGCSSVNYKEGPGLLDLSSVPVPRVGGPAITVRGGNASFAQILADSGYFSSVSQSGNSRDYFIDVKHGSVLYSNWGCVLVFWTVGIVPCKRQFEEQYTVNIKDANGRQLWFSHYDFKGDHVSSIWPHVYLFGASKKRVKKLHDAQLASNLIGDMNKLGLISR